MKRTHYDVLGVAPSASPEELKQAYHRLARRHHPDVQPGTGGGAHNPMVELNAAWAVLGDPDRRRAYDRTLPPDAVSDDAPGRRAAADLGDLLEPEPDPPPPQPSDALVLVPVALLALAVGAFAFSTMTEAPVLLVTSVVLLALAGACFLATPLLVLRRSVSRRRPGPR